MRRYKFSVVVEKEQGGFYASCPALPGCYATGRSRGEVMRAIRVHIEDRMGDNESVPQPEPVSFIRLEVVF